MIHIRVQLETFGRSFPPFLCQQIQKHTIKTHTGKTQSIDSYDAENDDDDDD